MLKLQHYPMYFGKTQKHNFEVGQFLSIGYFNFKYACKVRATFKGTGHLW